MLYVEGVTTVANVPEKTDRYAVARAVEGTLWYWGSWNTFDKAEKVARGFENGVVVDLGKDRED